MRAHSTKHMALQRWPWLQRVLSVQALQWAIVVWAACLPKEQLMPLSIALGGVLLGWVLATATAPDDAHFLLMMFLVSLVLRFSVVWVLDALSNVGMGFQPGHFLIGDGVGYMDNGWSILQHWRFGVPVDPDTFISRSGTIGAYDFWTAMVFSVTGLSPISPIIITSIAASLVLVVTYRLGRDLFDMYTARFAVVAAACWPSLYFWSIQNLKTSIIGLGLMMVVWGWNRLYYRKQFIGFVSVLIGLAVLVPLRFQLALILVGGSIPMSMWFTSRLWRNHKMLWTCLAVIGAVALALVGGGLIDRLREISWGRMTGSFSALEWLNYNRSVRAYGNLAFLPEWSIATPQDFLKFLPFGVSAAWLSPFPWQLGSSGQLSAAPEMLVYYLMLPWLVLGVSRAWKERNHEALLPLLTMLFASVVFGLLDGNLGTLFRHRSTILYLTFIFMGAGFNQYARRMPAPSGVS